MSWGILEQLPVIHSVRLDVLGRHIGLSLGDGSDGNADLCPFVGRHALDVHSANLSKSIGERVSLAHFRGIAASIS